MKIFETVVARNGFAAAARELDLAPAVVTRSIGELEQHLGVRLLQRSTRRLALTTVGEMYLDRVRTILSDLDEAEAVAGSQSSEVSGTLRVLALPALATHLVAPAIAEFTCQYPGIRIDLRSDEFAVEGIEAHDLTLLTDQVKTPTSIITRPLARSSAILCASPAYLRRRGEPCEPAALSDHSLIRFSSRGTRSDLLLLVDENEDSRSVEMAVDPIVLTNDYDAVLRATVEGAGISSQVVQIIAPMLHSGALQRVLRPWVTEQLNMIVALPSRRFLPVRTRVFIDYLVGYAQRVERAAEVVVPISHAAVASFKSNGGGRAHVASQLLCPG